MTTIYTINNKVLKKDGKWLIQDPLPLYTVRLKYADGVTPSFSKGTATQVSSSLNVWDLTYVNSDWSNLLRRQDYLTEVIELNNLDPATNEPVINDMSNLFRECRNLETVAPFTVMVANYMFADCTSLKTIPLFDTKFISDTSYMFYGCVNVESGALALYNQMSTQTVYPINNYSGTFNSCGSNTTTGAAELEQIPWVWK